jgi:glycosyltransferase involved in cell wall biosynthesis
MSLNLLKSLKQYGHEVVAVTYWSTNGEFGARLREIGVKEVLLPLGFLSKKLSVQTIWWTVKSMLLAPVLWVLWQNLIRRFRPDIVLLTNPKQGLWLYPWLARQPSFLIEHSSKEISTANRWMYQKLDRKLAGFIPVSQFMEGHLQELGVAKDHCTVIYNCVASPRDALCKTNTSTQRKPVVGIVGQIAPHKGHDDLLEAAVLLKQRGVSLEIKVFGSGEGQYVHQLKAQIARMQLDENWKWMKYVSNKSAVFGDIDICAVPSRFEEPFGMVALEASSFGIPVVASRRGGLPEIVEDRITGFLVDAANPVQLSDRIEFLVRDPDSAQAMGNSGRDKVLRDFSQEKMVSRFEALFRRHLLGRKA